MRKTPFSIFICISVSHLTLWTQDVEVIGDLNVTSAVNAAALSIEGNSTVTLSTTSTSVLRLYGANPLIEIRAPNSDYLAFIQSFGSDLYVANRLDGDMLFRTNNLNRMSISEIGNVGINTLSPSSRLSVNGYENDGIVAGLEVISGSQKMIMDGNELDCTSGDLHLNYNSLHDLLIRTNDRKAEITLEHSNGSGLFNGVAFSHPGSNDVFWTWYATNSDGHLELYNEGTQVGEFNAATGAYMALSDRHFKKNIRPLETILDRVLQLEASRYNMKKGTHKRDILGFIAQDVESLFPELVQHGTIGDTEQEIYMLDYSGFGVIAIAAIKEFVTTQVRENRDLRKANQELNTQIGDLRERIEELELRMNVAAD